jgi:hypothetical protein
MRFAKSSSAKFVAPLRTTAQVVPKVFDNFERALGRRVFSFRFLHLISSIFRQSVEHCVRFFGSPEESRMASADGARAHAPISI